MNTQVIELLDAEIEPMFELGLPNSAFKKVIPAVIKHKLR